MFTDNLKDLQFSRRTQIKLFGTNNSTVTKYLQLIVFVLGIEIRKPNISLFSNSYCFSSYIITINTY